MSNKPTAQQEKIITSLGSNVAVAAGAGSGKTQVLIGRFLHILEQSLQRGLDANNKYSVYVDQIVAITFTKKAAAEMRSRLRKELNQRLERLEEVWTAGEITKLQYLAEKDFWREQLLRLPRAQISTIHSLCSRILRENPLEAQLDPQFQVAEEAEGNMLVDRCLQQYIRQALRSHEEHITALAMQYGLGKFMTQIKLLLPCLRELESCADLAQPYLDELQSLEQDKQDLCAFLEDFLEHRDEYKKPKTYVPLVEELYSVQEQAKEGILQEEPDFSLLQPLMEKNASGDFKAIIQTFRNYKVMFAAKRRDALALPVLKHWQAVLGGLAAKVHEEKLAQDILTFDDLEDMAIDLLQRYPEVRRHWHARFRHIMVDEFQDTNDHQRQLIYLLCGDDAEKLEGDKLFIVGDPKQSIYRFRGADVSVFKRVQDEIRGLDGVSACLSMDKNFRSRESILSFVNALFEPLMGTDISKNVYFSPLEPDKPRLEGGRAVKLYLATYPKEEKKSAKAKEADAVAAKILQLHAEGVPFNEMTVLLRAMTPAPVLTAALRRQHIPFVVASGSGFFEQQEVQDLLNLFKVLQNKTCNLELAGILRSPYFGVDDESLTHIFLQAEASCLWDEVQAGAFTDCSQEQQQLLERARTLLEELRCTASSSGLVELWQELWQLLRIPAVLSLQEDGEAKLANVEKLRRLAYTYVEKEQGDLSAWLAKMEQAVDCNARETIAVVEAPAAVQIMTIHASKGLQFPVVLLPFLNSRKNTEENDVLWRAPRPGTGEPWGLGIKLPTDSGNAPSYLLEELRQLENSEEAQERQRQLYVAATRAERELYLFANAEEEKDYACGDWEDKNWFVQLESLLPCSEVFERADSMELQSYLGTLRLEKQEALATDAELLQPRPEYARLGTEVFSPSALQSYGHCPRAYFYHYGLHLPEFAPEQEQESTGQLKAASLGSIVHSTLEYYVKPGYDERTLRQCFKAAVKKHVAGWPQGLDKAWNMLVNYVQSPLCPPLDRAWKETEISFCVEGFRIEGVIDCMYANEDGTWSIVDFKRGHAPEPGERKNPGYMYQRALYRKAVELLYGYRVRSCELHYLQGPVTVALEGDEEYEHYLTEALKHCRSLAEQPREESCFPCRGGVGCSYCGYSYCCPGK